MPWRRFGGYLGLGMGIVFLFGGVAAYWDAFILPADENPYSKEAKKIAFEAGIPLIVALTIAILTLILRGLDRVTAFDSELCQFCVEELDRFSDSLNLYLACGDPSRSLALRSSANQHLDTTVRLFGRVVNKQRRERVLGHARSIGYRGHANSLNDSANLDLEVKRKLWWYAEWLRSDLVLTKEIKSAVKGGSG